MPTRRLHEQQRPVGAAIGPAGEAGVRLQHRHIHAELGEELVEWRIQQVICRQSGAR
jgi:hypothetical protein